MQDKEYASLGYNVPEFDVAKMREETHKNPTWIHFGAGNLFRAFHCNLAQSLLNNKEYDKGVVVCEGFDYEIVEKMYWPSDNKHILVTLKGDGSIEKTLVAGTSESLLLDETNKEQMARLKEIFSNPSLQMVTFTITEKGYSLTDPSGNTLKGIEADYTNGPDAVTSYIGKVASLLLARYKAGKLPIAMVSTDNCSHNGDKLYNAMNAFASNWVKNGFVEKGFEEYVNDGNKVSFPWSMIDKITPRPDTDVKAILAKDGLEGLDGVVTSKKTYIAPFVNSEETQYLVIEDHFPNGRPPLEKAGVLFTDRETVDKVEKMKVCTCLNPLHTCLAVSGCVLGYEKIADEMKDEDLVSLIKQIGYVEGLPVVVDPKILNPKEFIDTVIGKRLPNPFMPDTPQRIATDTSMKLSIRFGETIKAYGDKAKDLKYIPMVFSLWLRYLMGIKDDGTAFEISPDPKAEYVTGFIKDIKLGDSNVDVIDGLLHDKDIFGVDLFEVGLADKVKDYFKSLIKGPGAVRETIHNSL